MLATPDDPLPFVGQGAHGGVKAAAFVALLEIIRGRPAAVQDGLLGVFVKALLHEDRAEIAAVNVAGAPALFGDRCDAAVALKVRGLGIALALGSQPGQKPGGKDRSRTRQMLEDFTVRVLGEDLGDLNLEILDGLER